MKKNLYLLRHGQTLFNSKHLISGWSDSPLTEKGIEQAKRAGLFSKIKGSILTISTAQIFIEQ